MSQDPRHLDLITLYLKGRAAVVALGSNATSEGGTPSAIVSAALAALPNQGLPIRSVSRLYQNPSFPAGSGPDYVNAVAVVGCDGLEPAEVLARLHAVEAEFGRMRLVRWGARSLDLDLIAQGERVEPDLVEWRRWRDLPPERQMHEAPERLILPHPRLQDRAFVLIPLAEAAPWWHHPVTGEAVAALVDRLSPEDRAAVVPL